MANGGVTTAKLSSTTGTGAVALASLPSFTTTIGVGGATASASGSGITFPATQSASSDANTLDDYEEGTFTPTVLNGITPSYGSQIGYYTKVGNIVYYHILISLSGASSLNGGNLQFGGLPFTVNTVDSEGGYWVYANVFNTLGYFPTLYLNANSTSINFYNKNGSAVVGTNLDSASAALRVCGVYRAA